MIVYYQPFTTTDLLSWKHHTSSYSEKPQALIDLMESIMQTHRPTWYNCRQLLVTLFSTKEGRCLLQEALRYLETAAPVGTLDPAQGQERLRPKFNQIGTITERKVGLPCRGIERPSSLVSELEPEDPTICLKWPV